MLSELSEVAEDDDGYSLWGMRDHEQAYVPI